MQGNLELARNSSEVIPELYGDGSIGVVELLQNLRRQQDTAFNILDAYMGWRQALRELQELTYWDFEYDVPVLDRFGIDVNAMGGFEND